MPTSVSWTTFLIRTSSLDILRKQPGHDARPDTEYSTPKSFSRAADKPLDDDAESPFAARFFPLPLPFGSGSTAPPNSA